MRAAFAAVLLGFFAAGSALAQAPGVGKAALIKKTNGQVLRGRVIKELAQGFLFRVDGGSTVVVDFKDVADMSETGEAAAPSTSPPPAAAPEEGSCIPACRAGYTCNRGECVAWSGEAPPAVPAPASSECIPACRGGYVCSDGACVGEGEAAGEVEAPRSTQCVPACEGGQVCTPQAECLEASEARERVESGAPVSVKAVGERNRFQIFVGAILGPSGSSGPGGAIALGGGLVMPLQSWDLPGRGAIRHSRELENVRPVARA